MNWFCYRGADKEHIGCSEWREKFTSALTSAIFDFFVSGYLEWKLSGCEQALLKVAKWKTVLLERGVTCNMFRLAGRAKRERDIFSNQAVSVVPGMVTLIWPLSFSVLENRGLPPVHCVATTGAVCPPPLNIVYIHKDTPCLTSATQKFKSTYPYNLVLRPNYRYKILSKHMPQNAPFDFLTPHPTPTL